MPDRLWPRLLLGMSLAVAVAVGSVALLTRLATNESFADYVEDVSSARKLRVESVLSRHYQRRQSWAGVESMIQLVADLAGQRAVLADRSGQVVADSQNALVGTRVDPAWGGDVVIVTYQEKPVGSVYLDPLRPSNRVDSRAQTFLSATNRYLIWAALIGLLAALIVSLLLSRWLAAPLEALTRAARQMASGKLDQRIKVRIGGEVGALAEAFNSTAASLARLEGLRRQMVADIAHELRTPLTSVRGYLEAIQDGVAEPDPATLGIIQYELSQLTRLVNDLQELALVEAGELTLRPQNVDLADLIDREILALRQQAERRGVELRTDVAQGLPAIWADGGRLGQVLRNILRNALAHTPTGGTVSAALRPTPEHGFVIRIRDSGSGIRPEDLPHIFERFYRADKSRSRQGEGGHGLGLTISRELVRAHGGEISVASLLGEGTEFSIYLPPIRETPTADIGEALTTQAAGRKLRPRWPELIRSGALVAAVFGAAAGLAEAALLAVSARKLQVFFEVAGYSILIDGFAFGLLGGLGTAVALLIGRLLRRQLSPIRQVALLAPFGSVLVGLIGYLSWGLRFDENTVLATPRLFAPIAIFGLAALLVSLLAIVLAERQLSLAFALRFSRHWVPLALSLLVGLAIVGVSRDQGVRGLGLGPAPASASSSRAAPLGEPGPSTLASRPNVLLVTVDSLRADHIGAYGYQKARTPTLDSLAAGGVRFTNAVANQPNANPAQAAIFTGAYPASSGVRVHLVDRLDASFPTLAESLAGAGYQTGGIYSWISFGPAFSGLQRGFQTYLDVSVNRPVFLTEPPATSLAATYRRLKSILVLPGMVDRQFGLSDQVEELIDGRADVTTDAAIAWLRDVGASSATRSPAPFFLWLHYFDPHYPYTPPPPFDALEPDDCTDCFDGSLATIRWLESQRPELSPAQVNRLLQRYDGEIAFFDRELGRLLAYMQTMGIDQNSLIVVLGNGGEAFGEHGNWLHGGTLYDEEVHVPLLLRLPSVVPTGTVVDDVAQQVDIMPTILELLGLPGPARVDGRSLLPMLQHQAAGSDRFAVAELANRSKVTLVTRDWRLLKSIGDGRVELYRVADDPEDLHDLVDSEPDVVAELEALLDQWRSEHP